MVQTWELLVGLAIVRVQPGSLVAQEVARDLENRLLRRASWAATATLGQDLVHIRLFLGSAFVGKSVLA